jgi:TatD DNase family protein
MRYYDAHAHLADSRLGAGLDGVLAQSVEAGVCGILACAARLTEWESIVAISRRPCVLGALGLHPFFVDEAPADLGVRLRQGLHASARLAAVGEVGLDFWNGRDQAPAQHEILAVQLQVARELNLPVVLHNRRSWSDFFGLLRDCGYGSLRGVCHCFNGSREIARQVLDRGLLVSFCGPITYPTARRIREAAAYVPLDRILTETDCPDLPPEPCRGGLSLPWHVCYVVNAVAAAKGLSPAAVAEQVERNYQSLFERQTRASPDG